MKETLEEGFRKVAVDKISSKKNEIIDEWKANKEWFCKPHSRMSDKDIEEQGSKLISHLVKYVETGEKDELLGYVKEDLKSKIKRGYKPEDVEDSIRFWNYLIVRTLRPEFEKEDCKNAFAELVSGIFDDISGLVSKEAKKFYLADLELQVEERTKQLKESEEKFRKIFERANDGLAYLDASGEILVVNEEGERIFGGSREEMLGENFLNMGLVSSEDEQSLMDNFEKVLNRERDLMALHIRNRKGEEIDLECSASLMQSGDKPGIMVVARDVTERKRAEEALEQKTKQQNALLSSIPAFVYYKDTDSRLIATNKAFAEMVNVPIEQLPGKTALDLFPKEQAERFHTADRRVMESGKSIMNIEEEYIDAGGKPRWASTSKIPYFDEEGNLGGMVGISWDITERKKAEEELRRSEERYRSLVEGAGAGIATSDVEGRFIYVNQGLCKMIGYSEEELMGKQFIDFIHPADQENMLGLYMSALDNPQEGQELNFRVIRKDGSIVHLYTKPTVQWHDKEIAGFNAVITDLTEQKKAEDALRESEEKYRTLIEASVNAIVTIDGEAKVSVWNKAAEKIFRYTAEEAAGQRIDQLIIPESQKDLAKKGLKRFFNTGKGPLIGTIFGSYARRKDGREFPVEISIAPMKVGGEWQAVAMVIDITDRKRVEEEILESEEKLRSIIESSPDSITVTDFEGKIVECNQATLDMHSFSSKEEVIGLNAFDFIVPKDRERAVENMEKAARGESVRNIEYTLLTQDGREFPAELSASVVSDSDGKITSFVAITKDITERKKAEEELLRNDERLKILFDHAPDSLVLMDEEGRFVDGNLAAERIFGYKREEGIGKDLLEMGVIPPEEIERAAENLMKTMRGEITGPDEFKLIRKDGKTMTLETRTFPVSIAGQDLILATARDITEQKKAEEAKNALLSNTSHELRTPLTSIDGYARFMLSGKIGKLPEKHEKCLKIIVEESDRLRVLIDNFLDLITIDIEGLRMDMKEVSIGQIIDRLASSMKIQLEENGISISRKVPTDLGYVRGDAARLRQLFSNLLDNAIKFTPSGGSIEVRSTKDDETVVVEVVDSGVGISPKDLPHVFERFYQSDGSPTRKFKGVGLGLAICSEIVEAHGGHMEVESKLGKGSVFRVILPKSEEAKDG